MEVTGYPELARRYRVQSFVGAGPESMLLEHVQKAAGSDVVP